MLSSRPFAAALVWRTEKACKDFANEANFCTTAGKNEERENARLFEKPEKITNEWWRKGREKGSAGKDGGSHHENDN